MERITCATCAQAEDVPDNFWCVPTRLAIIAGVTDSKCLNCGDTMFTHERICMNCPYEPACTAKVKQVEEQLIKEGNT